MEKPILRETVFWVRETSFEIDTSASLSNQKIEVEVEDEDENHEFTNIFI